MPLATQRAPVEFLITIPKPATPHVVDSTINIDFIRILRGRCPTNTVCGLDWGGSYGGLQLVQQLPCRIRKSSSFTELLWIMVFLLFQMARHNIAKNSTCTKVRLFHIQVKRSTKSRNLDLNQIEKGSNFFQIIFAFLQFHKALLAC